MAWIWQLVYSLPLVILMHRNIVSSQEPADFQHSRFLLDASHNSQIIDLVSKEAPNVVSMKFETWSTPQKFTEQAIFSVAMSSTYIPRDAMIFAGTARRAGFTGDIVIAVSPGSNQNFLDKLKEYNTTVFTVPVQCAGRSDIRCNFKGQAQFPLTLMRSYLYQVWALKYPSSTYILTADFRDTLFQANPFKYKIEDWGPNAFDLVFFQEAHPNRVINRTPRVGRIFPQLLR